MRTRKITEQTEVEPTEELDRAAEALAKFAIENGVKPGKGMGFFIPGIEVDGEVIGPWEIEITRVVNHDPEEATAAICLRIGPNFQPPEDAVRDWCAMCDHEIAHENNAPNVPKVCLECFLEIGDGNIGAALERRAH